MHRCNSIEISRDDGAGSALFLAFVITRSKKENAKIRR